MTAKEFLNQYMDCEREIEQKQEKARRLRSLAERTTQSFSPAPGHSGPSDIVGTAAGNLADLAVEMEKDTQRLFRIMEDVEALVCRIPNPRQRDVIRMKYLQGYTLEMIAVKLHYSWRQILRFHKKAMLKIEELLQDVM